MLFAFKMPRIRHVPRKRSFGSFLSLFLQLSQLFLERFGSGCSDVARMFRGGLFNQHDVAILFGHRIVENAFANDEEVAFPEIDASVFQLDPQGALHDKEELVFIFVRVPRKTAFQFGNLDEGIIDLPDDMR